METLEKGKMMIFRVQTTRVNFVHCHRQNVSYAIDWDDKDNVEIFHSNLDDHRDNLFDIECPLIQLSFIA